MVTPVQQAVRYSDNLPLSLKPSKICVCNFQRFRLYDLESDPCTRGEPVDDFALEDLYDHLGNLVSLFGRDNSRIMHEQQLSEHAGLLVANLHNALAAQYTDPDAPQSHHSLAVLTVRLVFCLYAEDAGLFKPNSFSQYIEEYDAGHPRFQSASATPRLGLWVEKKQALEMCRTDAILQSPAASERVLIDRHRFRWHPVQSTTTHNTRQCCTSS